MVWKLYKMMAQALVQCAVTMCFYQTNAGRLDTQVNKLYRLKRIIMCVRCYYGFHPEFARNTYGTLENYLKQHISDQDWALLTQWQVVGPVQDTLQPKPVLDIA